MARRRQATLAFFVVTAIAGAAGSAQGFDPRRLDRMPRIEELPDPAMSAEEVKRRCRGLFGNARYGMTMAIQNYERAIDSPSTFLAPVLAEFRTDAAVVADPATGRPACAVSYSWRDNWRWPSMGEANIRASFDGRIVYRFLPPPRQHEGVLMIAQGDALQLTEFFYYPVDRDGDGNPTPGARIYKQWGLYTRD